jgi:hypothetical protein
MRLASLHIKNFRGLQDVEFSAPTPATVIVGPNAIGKTTLLEAVRLARCLLMPSYPGEEQQVLIALSILQPNTQRLSLEAMLGNPALPLEIKLGIELTEAELGRLEGNVSVLAQVHLRNSLSLPAGQEQLALFQFLSSPIGRTKLVEATEEIKKKVSELRSAGRLLYPTLVADPKGESLSGKDLLDQELVGFLGRTLPVGTGLFSYFPADRAMPTGEVAIQIGAADVQAQIQSHMGQPATKYSRLKQYIVNQSST